MNKRLLIIAGALIAIAIVFFILSSFVFNKNNVTTPTPGETNGQTTETPTQTTFPLSESVSADLVTQSQKEFDFAFAKAREWRDDTTPVAVVVKYTSGISIAKGKSTYVFVSPSLAQYYFTLMLDQAKNENGENSYERVLYFKDDYFLPLNTVVIPMKYWAINYVDALKKADELGGKNIRVANANYDVNLVLSNQENGLLLWDVEYLVNGEKMFSVAFDAYEGNVQ